MNGLGLSHDMHLTLDQIDDVLIGETCGTIAEHLDICAECAARVAAASAPFASFEQVSLQWAERRSATLPASVVSRLPFPMTARLAAAAGLCAALVLGVTDPALRTLTQPRAEAFSGATTTAEAGAPYAASQTAAFQSAASQVARDNRMLVTVAQETADADSAAAMDLASGPRNSAGSIVRN